MRSEVSVVIVNHNSGQALNVCVQAIQSQTVPVQEIIVVDNQSTDGSLTRLSNAVRVIHLEENLGLTRGRNTGLRAASGRLVLFVDDDVFLAPDCLEHLLAAYRRYRPAALVPTLVCSDRETIQSQGAEVHFIGMLHQKQAGEKLQPGRSPQPPLHSTAMIGGCMLLERDTFLAAGAFNEQYFFYFEDMEVSLRLRTLGHTILCVPAALAYHEPGQGTPGLSFRGQGVYPLQRAFLVMRNRWVTMLLHYRLRTFLVLAPALLLYESAALAAVIGRGWSAVWRRALLDIYRNRWQLLATRKRIQANRRLADRDLLSAGRLPFAVGFLRNPLEQRLASLLESLLDLYWRAVRGLVG
jgi:GT2 family glycosyltransferase